MSVLHRVTPLPTHNTAKKCLQKKAKKSCIVYRNSLMENPCTVRLSLPKRDIFRRTNTILKCYPFSKNFALSNFPFCAFHSTRLLFNCSLPRHRKKYRTKKILDERNVRRCAHVHEKNPTIPLFPTAHNIRTKEEIVCYFQCAEANEEWKRKNEKRKKSGEKTSFNALTRRRSK